MKVCFVFFLFVCSAPLNATAALNCSLIFEGEAHWPLGNYVHSLGVKALAVGAPLRALPRLMQGRPFSEIAHGRYNPPRGILTFEAVFSERSRSVGSEFLSLRPLDLQAPLAPPVKSDFIFLGDRERVLFLFSPDILDRIQWRLKSRVSLTRKPRQELTELSEHRSLDQRKTDLATWAVEDSARVLLTQDSLDLNDVEAVWVHPAQKEFFLKMWLENYGSAPWHLDLEQIESKIIFQVEQP